jgi:hypothetical protein
MAIVRCREHWISTGNQDTKYFFGAMPIGWPNPKIACGKNGCTNPGLVLMNLFEELDYIAGKRTFGLPFHEAKQVSLADGGQPLRAG